MIEVTIKCESCGSFCYFYMDDPMDRPKADCSFCGEELV